MARYFVGIGGQKCGSGWLANFLFRHPDVLRNPIKEMHVFDQRFAGQHIADRTEMVEERLDVNAATARTLEAELASAAPDDVADLERRLRSLRRSRRAHQDLLAIYLAGHADEAIRRYQAYFDDRVREHTLFGEITPSYSILPRAGFEAMLGAYPDARMIFVMRDPVDRLWSAVRHDARADGASVAPGRLVAALDDRGTAIRSAYERTLTTLDECVPAEQVLVLFYEDLFSADDDSAVVALTEFLGLEGASPDRGARVGPGDGEPVPDDEVPGAVVALGDTYRAVAERFDAIPPRWKERLALLEGAGRRRRFGLRRT
jgi:hypothetical protein